MAGERLLFTEEEWNVAAPEVGRQMHDHVFPYTTVISKHLGDHGEAVGTGAFLKLGERIFILTNEHVARVRTTTQDLVYQMANNDEPNFVRGNHASYELPFDMALLPVDEAVWSKSNHGSKAITPDMIAIAHAPVPTELFTFAGYSEQRGGFYFGTLVSLGTSSTSREVLLPPEDTRFNSRFHFGLDYRPNLAENVVGTAPLPRPPGFSGSIVWNTRFMESRMAGQPWTPELAQVTGLVWGWPSNVGCIVATRSEYLRSFILGATDHLVASLAGAKAS